MHECDDKRSVAQLSLPDEVATGELGAALAAALKVLPSGLLVYLEGDLGAGKTTLVRGLLRALGYSGKVKSPTYTFVEPYAISRLDLYHFDFYRFESAEEYLDGGFDEYFGKGGICLVEWPGQAAPYLPPADLRISLAVVDDGRHASLSGLSEEGRTCLTNLTRAKPHGAIFSSSSPPA
jgi:tRNA threonylcarbamoyladenosine biosynthesis protein TsaE